jgi:hypothetical protein
MDMKKELTIYDNALEEKDIINQIISDIKDAWNTTNQQAKEDCDCTADELYKYKITIAIEDVTGY